MDKNAQPNTAEMDNYKSATSQHHEQVENQILEEIREGRYVVTSRKPTIVNAIGAIQKTGGIHVRSLTTHICIYDSRLRFGARLSGGISQRLSQAIRRMMQRGSFNIVVYLDDYLVISDNYSDCMKGLNTLITLLRLLGFGIAWEKTAGPTRSLTFPGIKIGSESFRLSLPEDKVASLSTLLTGYKTKMRASCRQLQQLARRLSLAVHDVNGGRVYLQRVLDLLRSLKKADHKIHLADVFSEDITFWI
ncbi:hypothetical protein LSH36_186g04041 [Paralvinella palmiformis]|uniref:Reverse transcriptase domain-containing protein n=1 Tax=Paralvinella palmiformis TaxID=53620 RepID=A0AAD9JSA3_9ANNE|nr:hypothetical protein LSH36_186g04041 [Paralvinella palmiformis]